MTDDLAGKLMDQLGSVPFEVELSLGRSVAWGVPFEVELAFDMSPED